MGRRRLPLKKIEKPTSLQITYAKRKEWLRRKVNEMSELSDAEAGLLMFSPSGRLTCASSSGSKIEDIFLRHFNESDQHELHEGAVENEEHICQKLRHSKCEAEMLEMIETKEVLERRLAMIKRGQQIAEEKLRFYQPDVSKINSLSEAEEYEKFLNNAIERTVNLKEKLLERENHFGVPRPVDELQSAPILDGNCTSEESVSCTRMRFPSMNGNLQEQMYLPTGSPQLGLSHRSTSPTHLGPGHQFTGSPQLVPGHLIDQSLQNFASAGSASSSNPMGNFPSPGSPSSSTPMANFNGGHAFQGFGQGFPF